MRAFTGIVSAAIFLLSIVSGISTSTAAHDAGAEAAITIVAAGPPYGCGANAGNPGGNPGNGHGGTPPGCEGIAPPPAHNPRQGIIDRLQSEPSAYIRLAIRQCVNGMRGADWRDRYETCYYPSLTN